MKYFQILIIIFFSFYSEAQKKILDHSDFEIWNRIQNPKISAYGNFIMYSIQTGEKDSQLKIKYFKLPESFILTSFFNSKKQKTS